MTSRRVAVEPGVGLAVRETGDPRLPAILFANSLAAEAGMWDDVVQRLAGRARIVCYDARGHGASDAPAEGYGLARLAADALAILDALAIERALFCGLSLGGLTGMWLGVHAPERCCGLVLANTAANFPPAPMWLERAASVRRHGLAPMVQPTLERWFTPGFRERAPDRVAAVGAMISNTSVAGYAGCCETLAVADLAPDLFRITAPVRVVAGVHDPSTPPGRAAEIVAAIPRAELATLDAAHMSAVEAAPAFTDVLTDFASEIGWM